MEEPNPDHNGEARAERADNAVQEGASQRRSASRAEPPSRADAPTPIGVAQAAQDLVEAQLGVAVKRGADDLHEFSGALRQTAAALEHNLAAPFAQATAVQLERLSGFLRTNDAKSTLQTAEEFARKEPAIFLGGALALGLLASRFLRSSPPSVPGEKAASPGQSAQILPLAAASRKVL